jgi:hypothetical protein
MSLATLPGGHAQWPEYLAERTRLYPQPPPVPVVLENVQVRQKTKASRGRPSNLFNFFTCGACDPHREGDVDLNVVGPISSTSSKRRDFSFPHARGAGGVGL